MRGVKATKWLIAILLLIAAGGCTQANTRGSSTERNYNIRIANDGTLLIYTPIEATASTRTGAIKTNNDPTQTTDANASLAGKGATASLAAGAAKQLLEGVTAIAQDVLDQRDQSTSTKTTNQGAKSDEKQVKKADKPDKKADKPDKKEVTQGDFNLSKATWLHTNVSRWPVTARLSKVFQRAGKIYLEYDKANTWPGVGDGHINANPWVIVKYKGKWYAATWEWLRQGQTVKSAKAVDGSHIKRPPLNEWHPKAGEKIGFMISGLARDMRHFHNVKERSNIYWYTWR